MVAAQLNGVQWLGNSAKAHAVEGCCTWRWLGGHSYSRECYQNADEETTRQVVTFVARDRSIPTKALQVIRIDSERFAFGKRCQNSTRSS
jgi:hypothetical protein